jgi:hypothetical protein
VCLTYLGFIQNILGRLRTIAMTSAALLIASTVALSTHPFDPRQILSLVLIILFVVVGGVIVKVYADFLFSWLQPRHSCPEVEEQCSCCLMARYSFCR